MPHAAARRSTTTRPRPHGLRFSSSTTGSLLLKSATSIRTSTRPRWEPRVAGLPAGQIGFEVGEHLGKVGALVVGAPDDPEREDWGGVNNRDTPKVIVCGP